MNEIFILGTILMLLMKSIDTQLKNAERGDFRKIYKFIITLFMSTIIVIVAKYQTFYTFKILNELNVANFLILSLAIGMSATGSFDTIKTIVNLFPGRSKK